MAAVFYLAEEIFGRKTVSGLLSLSWPASSSAIFPSLAEKPVDTTARREQCHFFLGPGHLGMGKNPLQGYCVCFKFIYTKKNRFLKKDM